MGWWPSGGAAPGWGGGCCPHRRRRRLLPLGAPSWLAHGVRFFFALVLPAAPRVVPSTIGVNCVLHGVWRCWQPVSKRGRGVGRRHGRPRVVPPTSAPAPRLFMLEGLLAIVGHSVC